MFRRGPDGTPALVADCVAAMIAASPVEVTVKCRIGVDDQVPEVVLPEFLGAISEAGVRRVTIHARKAWLQGLSPKENRDVPPLDYPLVHRMKAVPASAHVDQRRHRLAGRGKAQLAAGMDGVMIGRAAYQTPADILGPRMPRSSGKRCPGRTAEDAVLAMLPYIEAHLAPGEAEPDHPAHAGAVRGPSRGAGWKRILSEGPIATARGRTGGTRAG
jgi:tRNA-dihydrouridine synthase A